MSTVMVMGMSMPAPAAVDHRGRSHQECVVAHETGKCRDLLFFFDHAEGDGDREQHRDQGKDYACHLVDRKDDEIYVGLGQERDGRLYLGLHQRRGKPQEDAAGRQSGDRHQQAASKGGEEIHDLILFHWSNPPRICTFVTALQVCAPHSTAP